MNPITQKEKEIVIARLEVLSPELHFCLGANNLNFSRDEIIKEIENNSEVGREFIKVDMDFLRALKDGSLMAALTSA